MNHGADPTEWGVGFLANIEAICLNIISGIIIVLLVLYFLYYSPLTTTIRLVYSNFFIFSQAKSPFLLS